MAQHQSISAQDKDIKPAVQKLVQLCTMELVTLMQEVDGTHPMDLEDKQQDINDLIDDILEEKYLDPLYGDDSKLTYEEWLERSSNENGVARVFYEPQNLRALVFTRASVDFQESAEFEKFAKENKIITGQTQESESEVQDG